MGQARQTGTTWQQGGIDAVCALQVFGMRRSGNHAIVDWLMRNAPDAATGGLFFNNCAPWADPREKYATLEVHGADGLSIPHQYRAEDVRLPEAGNQPMVVVSYEDRMPAAPHKQARNPSKGFADADFDHRVIIYRGFLNWAGSLLAKLQGNADWGPVDRMRIISRAFSTYADGLERLGDPKVTGICYDDWMTSEVYRTDRLTKLGLPLRDNGLGEVQRFGGGSSFQKKAATPADLKTASRGDQMSQDPEFLMLLWLAGHDLRFLEKLMPHFEADVERIAILAETAGLNLTLPASKGAA